MADMVDVADRVSWKDLLEQRARPAGLRGVPGLCLATALETNNRFAELAVYERLRKSSMHLYLESAWCQMLGRFTIHIYS